MPHLGRWSSAAGPRTRSAWLKSFECCWCTLHSAVLDQRVVLLSGMPLATPARMRMDSSARMVATAEDLAMRPTCCSTAQLQHDRLCGEEPLACGNCVMFM